MTKSAKPFEPMLAGTPKADTDIRFPVLASPKLDGVRGVCKDGALLSRSLKKIPNKWVQALMSMPELTGLDGELTVGPANAPNVMQATTSIVMSSSKPEQFQFHVFDKWDAMPYSFEERLERAGDLVERAKATWLSLAVALRLEGAPAWIMDCPLVMVQHELIEDMAALNAYEAKQLALGYEGIMVRNPAGDYKHGRSTVKEGGLLKLKRFTDGEAIIVGFEEEMENLNEKTVNEKGRSKRSSHAENKRGKGTLGAFVCALVPPLGKSLSSTAPTFNIGTGMDHALRAHVWANRDKFMNQIVKFKHFDHGAVDAPRHPVFLGFRSPLDMS